MRYPVHNLNKSSRGFSIITLLIIVALLIAAINVYAYFNPSFELSQFSVIHFLRDHNDKQRIADINKVKDAIEKYYNDHSEYPATDGWCGRIFSIMHPEVKDTINDYFNGAIPKDPAFGGTNKEYFYRREDKNTAVLMAALENLPSGSTTYNYSGCYDWPGDNIYNYRLTLTR